MDLATTPARRPMEAGMARRLWHVVLAVCHMLRRGLCRKRLMVDLHVLLGRGKLAGRALRGLLAHHAAAGTATTSRRRRRRPPRWRRSTAAARGRWSSAAPPRRRRTRTTGCSLQERGGGGGRRGGGGGGEYGGLDAAAVARAFEMMSAEVEGTPSSSAAAVQAAAGGWATATPSPMVAWILGEARRCPAAPRHRLAVPRRAGERRRRAARGRRRVRGLHQQVLRAAADAAVRRHAGLPAAPPRQVAGRRRPCSLASSIYHRWRCCGGAVAGAAKL